MDQHDRNILTQRYLHSLLQTSSHLPSEVPEDVYKQMVEVLAGVLVEISLVAKCRANWDDVKTYERPRGAAFAFLQDKKTGTEFNLVIDTTSTYLTFDLPHFYCLNHTNDSFWELLFSLKRLGDMKYELVSSPADSAGERWERSLLKCRKSTIYSMVADHILSFKEQQSDSDVAFPEFAAPEIRLTWTHPNGWEDLLPILTAAIQIGWRINYLLYLPAHQKRQRTTKTIIR